MTTPAIISDKRKIKIALVGCGRIAEKHVEAIMQCCDELELVALVDVDPDALCRMSAGYDVFHADPSQFTSLSECLQTSDADVYSLCTPSGLHAQQAIAVAQHGKHSICEKPMSTQLADAQALIDAIEHAQTQCFVVKQNRLNAPVQALAHALQQQRFGKVYFVTANVFWTRPQAYYDQASWRGTWALDGGALMNQACHYVDLLQWLIGPVASVQAMSATLARKIEAEDSIVLNLRWCHGALGSMNVTMLTYPRNLEGSITVMGEQGTVKIGGVALNHIEHWEFAESKPEDELITQSNYDTGSVYGFGHTAYYHEVIACLRGRADNHIDAREGYKTVELLTAAYQSARDGTTVSLPLTV
jgi:UDP-N-acetyl-2-amino-2-deoxyglucuronate dehydrogenase